MEICDAAKNILGRGRVGGKEWAEQGWLTVEGGDMVFISSRRPGQQPPPQQRVPPLGALLQPSNTEAPPSDLAVTAVEDLSLLAPAPALSPPSFLAFPRSQTPKHAIDQLAG